MTATKNTGSIQRYATLTEVASYFSVTPNTVSRWRAMRDDPLPSVTFPLMKTPRFDLEEVQAWAERRTACP